MLRATYRLKSKTFLPFISKKLHSISQKRSYIKVTTFIWLWHVCISAFKSQVMAQCRKKVGFFVCLKQSSLTWLAHHNFY